MLTFLVDKALILYLEIFKSRENDKWNRQESWDGQGMVGWERSLLQEGDPRTLMEMQKETATPVHVSLEQGRRSRGEQMKQEPAELETSGTDANSCETTVVSSRHYRTVVP